ncbi:GPI transamidase component [Grosmannia clavigera kw1407]|uniref:GPI transamidase component n=1 Tax=Grosmannia clavigera (strain kw1407 / UAMH 11150) TaxID=655863 RepID=F0XR92_GROCL|nr:GPI transamidase component [Grosmannia clavigera kw1407]EFW99949.1 GPI transamidase component [Grosmannia clavigera kw1407]
MPSPSPQPRRAGVDGFWTPRHGASGGSFSAYRSSTRSYLGRLPLFTRAIVALIVVVYLAGLQTVWDVRSWGALIPDKTGITTLYRTNTFPFVHLGFFHMLFNVVALTPLLERFEGEHGTLTSVALFFGPLSTLPAVLYVIIERVLHLNTTIMGSSIWVFLLLGVEAVRMCRTHPSFAVGTVHVPTWTTPLALVFVTSALVPHASLLGHLCGLAVGYLCGLGYLKFLAPPESVLRWIEGRLNLLGRLPRYVSVDQKTYGRFGVLPTTSSGPSGAGPAIGLVGSTQRLAVLAQVRGDGRMLKVPPYLALLCVVVGVVSLLVLPLDGQSRRTYISENALLPGQVHTYFGGSDQHVLRAYQAEVEGLVQANGTNAEVNSRLEGLLGGMGLRTGRQGYRYGGNGMPGTSATGENLYAILEAPRGDATEALVLVAAWRSAEGEANVQGVALALALARYFRRWSLWSKDLIFLFPPDSLAGPQAWVDAYHDAHDGRQVSALPRKSGALQGAVALDYTRAGMNGGQDLPAGPDGRPASRYSDTRFSAVHVVYDGVNGQLPNLDLINTVVAIAGGQMGTAVSLQHVWHHADSPADRLRTMLRGMLRQGVGAATGPHSAFMAYHVDAVTLQPYVATVRTPAGDILVDGWLQDAMAMGRILEATFRSLNNLLEHLHQSFFFYLLLGRERFVSIGTYLPSAMLVAANFTIMAIGLWLKSGREAGEEKLQKGDDRDLKHNDHQLETPPAERDLYLPLGFVAVCQSLGIVPLYVFNHLPTWLLTPGFVAFAIANALLPHVVARVLNASYRPSTQQFRLIKSFSLLLLGMFLSSLATLNFSLAFLVGLLASPLSLMAPAPRRTVVRWAATLLLNLVAPPAVFALACAASHLPLVDALRTAAFGWHVWGMYTAVVVWCVWWPAWLVGSVLVLGQPRE